MTVLVVVQLLMVCAFLTDQKLYPRPFLLELLELLELVLELVLELLELVLNE